MQERLAALIPAQASGLTITTFHGLGLRILREQHARLGLSEDFRIADETERLAALQEILDGNTDRRVRAILAKLAEHRRLSGDAAKSDVQLARPRRPSSSPEVSTDCLGVRRSTR